MASCCNAVSLLDLVERKESGVVFQGRPLAMLDVPGSFDTQPLLPLLNQGEAEGISHWKSHGSDIASDRLL